jgi:subtilisin family serine protease
MALTSGASEIVIGMIDGPVAVDHPLLAKENVRVLSDDAAQACARAGRIACTHGTFVAGILAAQRNSGAPAICPGCSLLVRPIFRNVTQDTPSATAKEFVETISGLFDAGVHVINFSGAILSSDGGGERQITEALNQAANRGVIVVAAAGNQSEITSSAITRHPWVIPVTACNDVGLPISQSNFGASIGRLGLRAPGDRITSLAAPEGWFTASGTSAAAPFVTGAIALLWSQFPQANAAEIKLAILQASTLRRNAIIPPLLNAWASYQILATKLPRR